MSRPIAKRLLLAEYLEKEKPAEIDVDTMAALKQRLAPISDRYLRELVRASGVPIAPLVDGVRQSSLEELERSLKALEEEYSSGDPVKARRARQLVIEAKDHARWALRRSGAERAREREEMIAWMLVWLENPPAFPLWVGIRKRVLAVPAAP